MIKIISVNNIKEINVVASEILLLIKARKFYFSGKYNDDEKVKGSNSFIELSRSINPEYKFKQLTCGNNEDATDLILLVNKLSELLTNKSKFMTFKLKDYSNDIKPKLCRELISELEDLYILGDIDRSDINEVYSTLGKLPPKKFTSNDLNKKGEDVYRAIWNAIQDNAQEIKTNSITHYVEMVNLIDPNDEMISQKEFLIAGRKKLSDLGTLRLCLACKFSSNLFIDLINTEFENLINAAANKITEHYQSDNETPDINIRRINLGGKGFDIIMSIDSKIINARAVPVNGCFVRFHYRYIIT